MLLIVSHQSEILKIEIIVTIWNALVGPVEIPKTSSAFSIWLLILGYIDSMNLYNIVQKLQYCLINIITTKTGS